MYDRAFVEEQVGWGLEVVSNMTEAIEHISPIDFNERHRYLPPSVTPEPGPIDFDINPFMKEIIDCFDIRSPVREVSVKKAVQITYTTVLESVLLYFMAHVRTAPCMFMTADREMALQRIENSIIPMIQQSGFEKIIQSSDYTNKRKTGKTNKQIQWVGGGYLLPFGANNADKMRSFSILCMLKDEIDAWADTVGKDGEPDELSDARTEAYTERRKIFRGSTPLIMHNSKIERNWLKGDQRRYYVRCKSCGFPQWFKWSGVNKETGHHYGIQWETENDLVIDESVKYVCQDCAHEHDDADKFFMMATENGAEWRPTKEHYDPEIRSYHIPGLLSPFVPWAHRVKKWVQCYDVKKKRPIDNALLQVFYNNVLAEPFDISGTRITFQTVSKLRRPVYRLGEVPNRWARDYCESKIQFITMAVDVHDDNLAVATFGWTKGKRSFLIDYWRFEGPEGSGRDKEHPETWGKVHDLLQNKRYISDDGYEYAIVMGLVDSSYAQNTVIEFCNIYNSQPYPIVGRDTPPKSANVKEFWDHTSKMDTTVIGVNVGLYKDRNAVNLIRYWDGENTQPMGMFNAPTDTPDKVIKELTGETRRDKVDKQTGKILGSEWHRTRDNELWDLMQYNSAACDMLIYDVCINRLELERVDELLFWDLVEKEELYYTKL